MDEIDEFGFGQEPSVEEKIDALAKQPLISTGKPPSPESVAEAKRIAGLADMTDNELTALGAGIGVHVSIPPPDADPDEEPPEPEGHALPQDVADWIASDPGKPEFFHGPLPHDVAAIWAHPPHRVSDEALARKLIHAWGMDGFRGSALHQQALGDVARGANSAEVTARFKAEREKKERKR